MANPRVSKVVSDVYVVVTGWAAFSTNVYLIRSGSSWTLVNAGWFGSEKKNRAAAESVFGPGARPVSMVLTHLHPDHFRSHPVVGGTLGPTGVRASRRDAHLPPDTRRVPDSARRLAVPLIRRLPKKTQAKIAAAADLTAVVRAFDPKAGIPGLPGWALIHSPGHTPGHLSLYRRSDGVLITGDAVVTGDLNSPLRILTGRQGVFGPPR